MKKLVTLESVGCGHPDKVADKISDAILDMFLEKDPQAHVACETLVTTNKVILSGEIKSTYSVTDADIQAVVRSTIACIGYNFEELNFSADSVEIVNNLHAQSCDIDAGVGDDSGAGDQGIIYGYACNETPQCQPLVQVIVNDLVKELDSRRGAFDYLYPDTKAQVTLEYRDDEPVSIKAVVFAISHTESVPHEALKKLAMDVMFNVLQKHNCSGLYDPTSTEVIVNGTGKFCVAGPDSDTGLTGRKIVIDQCGLAPVGGGAFSGKDPSKVDRSAAYAARQIAKALVKAEICDKALVAMSYCIGLSQPMSFAIDTKGTSKVSFSDEELSLIVAKACDLSPRAIIRDLNLRHIRYTDYDNYSHYSHQDAPWEQTKKLEEQFKTLLK